MKRLFLLLFILILLTACNFPIRSLSGSFHPRPTLDQSIFDRTRTVTPTPLATPVLSTPLAVDPEKYISYAAQSGDTLPVVARHFSVLDSQIESPNLIPVSGLIPPGQQLIIPRNEVNGATIDGFLPDSAVIASPCSSGFDLSDFVARSGGYLNFHQQEAARKQRSGVEIVEFVSKNTSVDPRLLLALTEFRSGWVYRYTAQPELTNPLGLYQKYFEGYYLELALAARWVNTGYYAWRHGDLNEVTFKDGVSMRVPPDLNAGSVGILYLFAQLYPSTEWKNQLLGSNGFLTLYWNMFGDPATCAAALEPLLTADIQPPVLELPFPAGETWSFTGGLHADWNEGTPLGAMDFAPILDEPDCAVSASWVTAAASGTISRSSDGMVIIALEDLQGNPTGWEIVYMHVAEKDRVALGTRVLTNDRIGHPSCEGGVSTGTHVHITRKFKGEWIGADGPLPFILSGWLAVPGNQPYRSTLTRDGFVILPQSAGSHNPAIYR